MRSFKLFFLLFSLTLWAAACGETQERNTVAKSGNTNVASTPQSTATVDELASARKIYLDNCAGCHREDGKGGPVEIEGKKIEPEDLTTDKIKKLTDDRMFRYIKNGIEDEGMPAFKDKLSDEQIRDVVRFIRRELQNVPAS